MQYTFHKVALKLVSPFIYLRDKIVEMRVQSLNEEDRFTLFYKSKYWKGGGGGSASGAGSSFEATKNLRHELPKFLMEYNISSILDVPCGDFFWMSMLDLNRITYTGGDIVKELIDSNKAKYANNNMKFIKINLCEDELPCVNLIFVRDCFVHLSNNHVFKALSNIVCSKSKYLATTTFPEMIENNDDSPHADRWRPINLIKPPFNFPEPVELLDDSWSANSVDASKKIGVWRIEDILL